MNTRPLLRNGLCCFQQQLRCRVLDEPPMAYYERGEVNVESLIVGANSKDGTVQMYYDWMDVSTTTIAKIGPRSSSFKMNDVR